MLKRMIDYLRSGRSRYIIIFTLAGGLAGFLYWRFIGCTSGTCPIKSVWYYSSLYGLVLGYLVGDLSSSLFFKKKKEESQDQ
jgi:hypothetical protein